MKSRSAPKKSSVIATRPQTTEEHCDTAEQTGSVVNVSRIISLHMYLDGHRFIPSLANGQSSSIDSNAWLFRAAKASS